MEVFISYEYTKNYKLVNQLAEQLRSHHIKPAILDLQVSVGGNQRKLPTKIIQALKHCDYAVAMLTHDYVQDEWLQKELNALYNRDQLMDTDFLFPILVEDCAVPAYIEKDKIIDLRGKPQEKIFDHISPYLSKLRQVFVVMKIGDPTLNQIYAKHIQPAITESGFIPLRIDEVQKSDPITPQILAEIRKSPVIFVDLTGHSPNCYYEVGYAHALDKTIILSIKDSKKPIPFDLSVHNFIKWKSGDDLKSAIKTRLDAIQEQLNIH
jgi:TIR domain